MGYWKGIGSILLSTTSEQNSSGFPVVAAIIFVAHYHDCYMGYD